MNMRLFFAGSLLLVATTVAAETQTYKYPMAESLPDDDTSVFPRDPALLTGHDVHLTAERFFNSWSNKENERERIKANMYFLGVLDATEGKFWCDYKKILPSSAHEYIYSKLSKLNADQRQEPAAQYIVNAMADILPCKKGIEK